MNEICRCNECGEIKDILEFTNLQWSITETHVCSDCKYNNYEAQQERWERAKWKWEEEGEKPARAYLTKDQLIEVIARQTRTPEWKAAVITLGATLGRLEEVIVSRVPEQEQKRWIAAVEEFMLERIWSNSCGD